MWIIEMDGSSLVIVECFVFGLAWLGSLYVIIRSGPSWFESVVYDFSSPDIIFIIFLATIK